MINIETEIYNEINEKDGKLYVSSLRVADYFNKEHRNVIRNIKEGEWGKEFGLLNYEQSYYMNSQGKRQPCYLMTKEGFMMIAFGFTGKKATKIKVAFINAFMKMREELQKREADARLWQESREKNKLGFKESASAIGEYLVPLAIEQGSRNSDKLYAAYFRMVKNQLFESDLKFTPDNLTNEQLAIKSAADILLTKIVKKMVNEGAHYKEIYQEAKKKIQDYANIVGTTPVIPPPKNHLKLIS